MIILAQAHNYHLYETLLDQMFRLRKTVFHDQLEWDVQVADDIERDAYDDLCPAYILWCDDAGETLYGALRLMPTTGPTLLHDVFRSTFPKSLNLVGPGIWEGTRMCIDEDALAKSFPNMTPSTAFCLLLKALCEVALHHGIHTLISNYEPHMKRIYMKAGARLEEVGRSDGYGKKPVCCGVFEVSESVHEAMCEKLNFDGNLYRPPYRSFPYLGVAPAYLIAQSAML